MPDYRIDVEQAHGHRFRVTLTLPRPAARQRLMLPAWVPGSYVVRDMARHLSAWDARQGGRAVPLEQQDKTSWVAACSGEADALVVGCTVYANDASVRGAFLDAARGFFDGSSMFLRADGHDDAVHRVEIGELPPGWQADTAMDRAGPQCWQAAGYRELIDHPFLLGTHWRGSFVAGGVEHRVCVDGAWPSFDGDRLVADLARLCATQIAFWHGDALAPPFERYVFLLRAGDDGAGGGLEHRASCALAVARRDLPRHGGTGDGYAGLLSLASHEYFHAWLAKRLRAPELAAPDLAREAPTQLLWFFEGFTSYYDDLLLLRSGLIDDERYLQQLARSVNTVQGSPGRRAQSVAEASRDAWTRGDRSDENAGNATVSYYAKGALIALLCDLALRGRGRSLDALLRGLWRDARDGLVDEDAIAAALRSGGGDDLVARWRESVHGTDELPLAEALATVGIRLQLQPPTLAALLGLRLSEGAVGGVHVRQVLRGGAAEAAGVASGDELLAVDGWRIRRLDDARQWIAGDGFDLLLARDQRLLTLHPALPAVNAAPVLPQWRLLPDPGAGAAALALCDRWLRGS